MDRPLLWRDLQLINGLSTELARVHDIEELYECGLDAVIEATSSDRAALLLFDDAGSMRFQAWRGLSEDYRRAVEGHSPWPADARDPQPIRVEDALEDADLAPYREVIAAEGLRAMAFVPVVYRDRLLGKFMLYYEQPHRFTNRQLLIATTISNYLAFAVERHRSENTLREADRRKDEFLALLGHELRNPLAALEAGVRLLTERPREEDRPRVQGMLEDQVHQLMHLVDDLLDLNRISHGKVELRRETVDLQTLVDRTVAVVEPRLAERGQRLAVRIDTALTNGHGALVLVDPTRLEQIVVNLLANASNHVPEGGNITLEATVAPGELRLVVRDDGFGIPADELERIFEPFVQGRRAAQGLGIGLSLVRRLAELHGGRAEAASDGPDRGSAFTVVLPQPATLAAPKRAAPRRSLRRLSVPLRVLVVDDNRSAASSMAALLEIAGADVVEAHSGTDALEVARRAHPDVVLLDLGLPDLSGFEVAAALRAAGGDPRLRIVAFTGYGDNATRERVRDGGFDDYLLKPARLEALLDAIDPGGAEPAPGLV
ncbi:MAG TPA: ATP-binding protein [Thermoanaerobaculia bacterium]|nr:ATP-binding protein [Thermoanaerobaculia bacterium]